MSTTRKPRDPHSRAHIHRAETLGDRVADAVLLTMGSWRFILIQTAIVLLWIGANLWLMSRPFDPYPFILLNLLFSTQAAYASPLILMSGNRQAMKDHKRDDLEAKEVATLVKMNQQQLEILRLLHQLAAPEGKKPA